METTNSPRKKNEEVRSTRSRRSSTAASSKATDDLQAQRKAVAQSALKRVTRAASKRPRRSCTAPGYKRNEAVVPKPRAPAKRVPKSKRRARSSFPAGLEKFPHILCTNHYPGHTRNDDGGASCANVGGVPKQLGDAWSTKVDELEDPTGLAWLRPRRTFSLWDYLAEEQRAACNAANTAVANDVRPAGMDTLTLLVQSQNPVGKIAPSSAADSPNDFVALEPNVPG